MGSHTGPEILGGYDEAGRCLHCERPALEPMYRKWWVWLICAFVLIGLLGSFAG